MPRKRHKPEEIVANCQVDVLVAQDRSVADAVRSIGITEVTYYRWCQEFSGLKTDQVKHLKDLGTENARLRRAIAELTIARQVDPARGGPGKLLSPARRRACIEHVWHKLQVSECRARAALGQNRSTQRKIPRGRDNDERLTAAELIELGRRYCGYGYRKIAELLRRAGWHINDKRVERIWRRDGPKVPPKQPKRGRLWLADGSPGLHRVNTTILTRRINDLKLFSRS